MPRRFVDLSIYLENDVIELALSGLKAAFASFHVLTTATRLPTVAQLIALLTASPFRPVPRRAN